MITSNAVLQRAAAPPLARSMVFAGSVLTAGVVGLALAYRLPLGLAMLVGLGYLPIALYRLPLAIALFIPLVFLEAFPALNLAAKAGGLLLAVTWIGATLDGRRQLESVATPNRRVFATLGLMLIWLTLSLAWAESTGAVFADIWRWYAVALLFLIIATTATSVNKVRLMIAAFVAGSALSILVGFATGKFNTGSALATAASDNARLEGGLGDPNFLAAGAIAAIVLAAALLVSTRAVLARWTLCIAIGVLTSGLLTSQSRGGMLATMVVMGAAVVVFKRRRNLVVLFLLLFIGSAAVWFASTPTAWERITNIDNGGSGRDDLWTIGWRMAEDQPVAGVGLNNFQERAKDYTRQPGTLRYVSNIVDRPHVVHNTYLQLLAETGVVGLAFFLALVFMCLRASLLAARRFAAVGDYGMEMLAQGVAVAAIGILTAAFFISAGIDKPIWIILALGPALLAVASQPQRDEGSSFGVAPLRPASWPSRRPAETVKLSARP